MILIVTYKEDYTVDFLVTKLNEQKKQFIRLNTEEIEKYSYDWFNHSDASFRINEVKDFEGVWFRRLKLPEFNTDATISDYLATEYEFLFSNLLRNINARYWMSQPDALYRAENKIVQLKAAESLHFNIPATLLSNNKILVKEFEEKHSSSGIIIKPLFSGRIELSEGVQLIYTNEVDKGHLNTLDEYDLTPCIFQKKIAKDYELRVTVVGKRVFAAKVNSQEHEKTKIDWRRQRLNFEAYTLPDDLKNMCIRLVQSLDINFGAIDMIKSTDGSYYFLEINPNGQWAWIEIDTGMSISQAIIDFLYGE